MTVEGHVDRLDERGVEGWAVDRARPDRRVQLELVYRGAVIAGTSADQFREDLAAAGIGDGNAGFGFALPAFFPKSELAHLRLQADAGGVTLDLDRFRPEAEADRGTTSSRFGGLWVDRSDFAARLSAKLSAGSVSAVVADELERFARDGYVIIKGAVDPETVDKLNAEIEGFWRRPPAGMLIETFEPDGKMKYIPPEVAFRLGRTKLLDIYAFSAAARAAVAAPRAMDFLEALLEDKPKAFQGLSFWNGSEQAIHKDSAYVKVDTNPMHLTASWLALEDIAPGTGELEYYIGSHRAPDYLFGGSHKWMENAPVEHDAFLDSLHVDAERFGFERSSFLARKGDLLVWHADLAHGGAPIRNTDATRKSLVTHFTAARDVPFYERSNLHRKLVASRCVFMSSYTDILADPSARTG